MQINSTIGGALFVAGSAVASTVPRNYKNGTADAVPVISSTVVTTLTVHATVTDHVTDHVTVLDTVTAAVCMTAVPGLASSGALLDGHANYEQGGNGGQALSSGLSVSMSGSPGGSSIVNAAGYTISTATSWTGFTQTQAAPTLSPAIPFGHDPGQIKHLTPSDNCAIHYTDSSVDDAAKQKIYASMNATFVHPAVVLEHSSLISNVTCTGSGMSIKMANQEALVHCQENWDSNKLILATTACGADNDGQNAYFIVSGIDYDSSSLTAHCQVIEVDIPDCMTNVELTWGSISPNSTVYGNGTTAGPYTNGTSSSGPFNNSTSSPGSSSNNGVSTNTNSTTAACGAPPAATISGFPAAACGESFDRTLDDLLGYLDFDDADFSSSLQDLAPGLSDYSESDYEDDDVVGGVSATTSTSTKRGMKRKSFVERRAAHIHKRWSLKSFIQKTVKATVNFVKEAPKAISTAVVNTAKAGYNFVKDTVSSLLNPSVDASTNFNIAPKTLSDSVFGQAYPLYHLDKTSGAASGSIDFYCVDCQVKGYIHVAGKVNFNILSASITEGYVQCDGNLLAQANLGIAAQASYKPDPFKKNIAAQGIPILTIPKVIVVGPEFALDASLGINIEANGQVLVGASASLPNFNARLDLVDSAKTTATGFTPTFSTRFEAKGEITVTTTLGFPITMGVGIDLVPLGTKGRRLISVINEPSVSLTAKYATEGDCANGIAYSMALADDTSLDFFQLKSVSLANFKSPDLVSGCKSLGSGASTGATATTAAADSTATDAPSTDSLSPTGTDATDPTGTGSPAPAGTDASEPTGTEVSQPTGTSGSEGAATDATEAAVTGGAEPATAGGSESAAVDASQSTGTGSPESAATSGGVEKRVIRRQDDASSSNDTIIDSSDDSNGSATQFGFVYTAIVDQSGSYVLTNDDDGNLGLTAGDGSSDARTATAAALSTPGAAYSSYDQVITSDDSDRIFHYYPDTMTAFGVSRLRISSIDQIPKGADIITLLPVNYDDSDSTPGIYMAVDTKGNYFYIMACDIEGDAAKIFIASDPDAGAIKLAEADLRYIVTGGVVQDCSFMPFVSTGAGLS